MATCPRSEDDSNTAFPSICLDGGIRVKAGHIQGRTDGPSSGLNFAAAERSWKSLRSSDPRDPVVLIPLYDRMERYFSIKLFAGLKD